MYALRLHTVPQKSRRVIPPIEKEEEKEKPSLLLLLIASKIEVLIPRYIHGQCQGLTSYYNSFFETHAIEFCLGDTTHPCFFHLKGERTQHHELQYML
eukprot:scaffold4693_cov82-Skeletonema_marinoi.AAC.4